MACRNVCRTVLHFVLLCDFLCRSTFPGSGRYAGQWTGDNSATWQALADSVASTLVPSMWGISMVRAWRCLAAHLLRHCRLPCHHFSSVEA